MNIGQKKLPSTSLAKFGFLGAVGGTGVGAVQGVVDKNTNPHADYDTVQKHALEGGIVGLVGGLSVGGIYKAFDGFAESSLKTSIYTNSASGGSTINSLLGRSSLGTPTNQAQQMVMGT